MMHVTQWLSEAEQEAWRGLLNMTSKLEGRLNHQLHEEFGLSVSDYGVLVQLSETPEGRLRIFELGNRLYWEQSRLSHHLARMLQRRLVEREHCSSDGRGVCIVLTQAGREVLERAAPAHVAAVRKLFLSALEPGQVRAMVAITSQVLARMDDTLMADRVEQA